MRDTDRSEETVPGAAHHDPVRTEDPLILHGGADVLAYDASECWQIHRTLDGERDVGGESLSGMKRQHGSLS